jgi:hypothetical protein
MVGSSYQPIDQDQLNMPLDLAKMKTIEGLENKLTATKFLSNKTKQG